MLGSEPIRGVADFRCRGSPDLTGQLKLGMRGALIMQCREAHTSSRASNEPPLFDQGEAIPHINKSC
jgi:hypothetical protein